VQGEGILRSASARKCNFVVFQDKKKKSACRDECSLLHQTVEVGEPSLVEAEEPSLAEATACRQKQRQGAEGGQHMLASEDLQEQQLAPCRPCIERGDPYTLRRRP
jgi:hypothetical protein